MARGKWDGLSDHPSNIRPECDPAKTPCMRRGRRPTCECNSPACADCRNRATHRRWYARNKEAVKARQRRWYARNKEAVKARHAAYLVEVKRDGRNGRQHESDLDAKALKVKRRLSRCFILTTER
jgi:hypothetical protein